MIIHLILCKEDFSKHKNKFHKGKWKDWTAQNLKSFAFEESP